MHDVIDEGHQDGDRRPREIIALYDTLAAITPGSLHLFHGYEIQQNITAKVARKTGSLYAVLDLATSPVDELQWFTTLITVQGKHITIAMNVTMMVDYTEPENVQRAPERAGRWLDQLGGAVALQAHDPKSIYHFKSVHIRALP